VLVATAAVGGIEPRNARSLMPPQRSVILDAELCEHTRCEPIGVPLAGHGKFNDLLPTALSRDLPSR
jgi:hypothetical protein